jgi:hypothetical protein
MKKTRNFTPYLFRKGDGNEGNFPRFIVLIADDESPWAALKALVCNEYIAGRRVRRFIASNIEVEGEGGQYGVLATIYEGPDGESAFGAAWITAALEHLTEADREFYADRATSSYTLKEVLDGAAWKLFRKESKDYAPPPVYSVMPGRNIYWNGVPFISINREGLASPTEADRITRTIADLLNANPEKLNADREAAALDLAKYQAEAAARREAAAPSAL